MNPVEFEFSNSLFRAPHDLDESQVATIPAYMGTVQGPHNLEGAQFVVVAWKPTPEEIEQIVLGGLVYISMLGGLAPHFLTTKVEEACYHR